MEVGSELSPVSSVQVRVESSVSKVRIQVKSLAESWVSEVLVRVVFQVSGVQVQLHSQVSFTNQSNTNSPFVNTSFSAVSLSLCRTSVLLSSPSLLPLKKHLSQEGKRGLVAHGLGTIFKLPFAGPCQC